MNFEVISTNLVQNLSDFGLKIIGVIAESKSYLDLGVV